MNKKNVIAIIIDLKQIHKSPKYVNFFLKLKELQSNDVDGYIIDTSDLFSMRPTNLNFKFQPENKNQFYFQPKNFFELYKICKDIKCIGIYHIPNSIKFLPKQFLLKLFGIKRFAVSGLGYIADNTIEKKSRFYLKFKFLLEFRLNYYFFRIFQIVGFFKNIDYFFEANQETINQIQSSLSKRIENKYKFLNFSFYKKICRINSYPYDKFVVNKPNIKNEYIVLIDSGFDHIDRIKREGIPSSTSREKYYSSLIKFLEEICKLLGKEIIICLHPKAQYVECEGLKKLKRKYKVVLNKTDEFIYQADTCIFFESSAIITAIMLKKKIINLNSKLMGPYYYKRNNIYDKYISFEKIDLDDFELPLNKFELIDKLQGNIESYKKYIQNNIIYEYDTTSFKQVKQTLDIQFFRNSSK